MGTKRDKKALAIEAVRKYLESEGWQVLTVKLDAEPPRAVAGTEYGHVLPIRFDGAKPE